MAFDAKAGLQSMFGGLATGGTAPLGGMAIMEDILGKKRKYEDNPGTDMFLGKNGQEKGGFLKNFGTSLLDQLLGRY